MKPLFIMDTDGHVRPNRATAGEIESFITDARYGEQLAHLTLGDDGDLVATPITDDEMKALTDALQADQEMRLRSLLDGVLAIARQAIEVPSVMWSPPVALWPTTAPWVERVMRQWAADHALTVEDESPPRHPDKHWIRCAHVYLERDDVYNRLDICRCQWLSIEVNTDSVIDQEVAAVRIEREIAARELEAF